MLRFVLNNRLKANCILFLSIITSLNAQIVSVYSSHPLRIGARASGLAESYVADAHDVNSMYWNPASIAYLENISVIVNHFQEQVINGMNENVTFPLRIQDNENMAFGLTLNHVGYIGRSKGDDFKGVQYGYDMAYGREILPTFSMGIGIDVRYARSTSSHLWGISTSIGAFYLPYPEVSYGMVYSGMGSGILYTFDHGMTTFTSENLPQILGAGVELRFPASVNKRFLTISVVNEKVFGEEGLQYKGGVELILYRFFALRCGYVRNLDEEGARYGAGIRAGRLQVDYSISPSKLTDRSSHISIQVVL